MSIKRYEHIRNFDRTPEPRGARRMSRTRPIFVIQQHDASSMHFDFRIEVDGVLRSWAVPKGPSTDPREKRLAVPTEDHPIAYADFEGVIPEGEYGAGAVIVWDRGIYHNMTRDRNDEPRRASTALAKGHMLIRLDGQKIKGGYALQRTGKGRHARWFLVKIRDDEADARRNPVSTQRKSVVSGRTVKEIARAHH